MLGNSGFLPKWTAAVVLLSLTASWSEAGELNGAWDMSGYETGGKNQRQISGLLIVADDHFGLIYSMLSEDGSLVGRAHFGRYEVEDDQLHFDVKWWPEKIHGQARAVPPVRETASFAIQESVLKLRFGTGSIQRWTKLDAEGFAHLSGVWRVENVRTEDVSQNAAGLLLIAEDRFALVSSTGSSPDEQTLLARGGSLDFEGSSLLMTTDWKVSFADEEGEVSNTREIMTLSLPEPSIALINHPGNKTINLRR